MEIEEPLRRKSRKKNRVWVWWVLVIAVILISYWEISHVVDYQQKQEAMVVQAYQTEQAIWCRQYINDTTLTGTAAEQTLNVICHE